MISIILLVGVAVLLSTGIMRKALPFESLLAFGLAGAIMMGLLLSGNLG